MDKMTPWFKDGLKFKCTGCGKCCTGSPGYVFLSVSDLDRLTNHLKMTEEEFIPRYTRRVENQLSLIDAPGTDACIFLKDNRCTVYEARPVQCQTYPWWLHLIRSPKAWNEAADHCEGINHPEGSIVPLLHIETNCASYLDNFIEQNFSFD